MAETENQDEGAVRPNGVRRSANEQLRTLVELTGDGNPSGGRDFVCECGVTTCTSRVHLDVATYDLLRQNGWRVLLPGHATP